MSVGKGGVVARVAAGFAGIGAGALLYAFAVERARVALDRYTVVVDKPGLPPADLTILHLADLHFRAHDRIQDVRLARLRRLLSREHYDMVAFTGDLIHDEAGLPAALAFLRELRPRYGTFTVPGNRDYWQSSFSVLLGSPEERAEKSMRGRVALAARGIGRYLDQVMHNQRSSLQLRRNDLAAMHAALRAQDASPLVNRAEKVRRDGLDLWVAGVDDLTQGQPDLDAALDAVPDGALLVLLAHNPDHWLDPRARRADLVLSGHTHGGQLRLPVLGALYRQGTHLARNGAAGWFESDGSRMFVSRGLGESFPLRFGALPQAALIHIVTQEPP